ncbi:MAG: 3-isopropylmalate dehydrogenase [Clostridiales bacterium]|nr:3-isopropylmalate dehydrogenase [Clostridiales bacterium]
MKTYKIAVIKGDGIGPEIVSSAMKVLGKAADMHGFRLEFNEVLAGGSAIDEYGVPLPDSTLNVCKGSDAVLLGAVGGPKWDNVDPALRPEKALLGLRKELGLFLNLRPAWVYPELESSSPVKGGAGMDLLIVRELTGGIYFGKSGSYDSEDGVVAFDTESYSESEIRRVVKQAFEFAQKRKGKLTVVDKANVLTTSRQWRKVANELSADHPDVQLDFMYIDNCTMQLIGHPGSFDVIVTSNMFGDIISDEAGMITGSVGMLPSASLGSAGPGLFEPVHGSAPDIAGTGKANPLATILSASMMLLYALDEPEAQLCIESAVKSALAAGYRTPDIATGGEREILVGTDDMTEAVLGLMQ